MFSYKELIKKDNQYHRNIKDSVFIGKKYPNQNKNMYKF